jgi:sugar phosphate isomerase/epimerase
MIRVNRGNTPLLTRRAFIQASGATAAFAAVADSALARVAHDTAGIQLYTLQAPLVSDFCGTLESLQRIGYREVEMVGLLGHDAREYRRVLAKVGLEIPSCHVLSNKAQTLFTSMATGQLPPTEAWAKITAEMDITRIESILEDMFAQSASLGNKYLVLAVVDSALLKTRAGIDKLIDAFTKAGDMCHARGLRFAFHPHLAEFARIDGVRAGDIILNNTDPERVLIELDFFWAAAAGVDIPQWLEAHSGRVHLGHVKDMAGGIVIPPGGFRELDEFKTDPFEDIGYGKLDYQTWIPLAKKAGMRHFFVERDNAPAPLENAARSLPNLRKLLARRGSA